MCIMEVFIIPVMVFITINIISITSVVRRASMLISVVCPPGVMMTSKISIISRGFGRPEGSNNHTSRPYFCLKNFIQLTTCIK